MSKERFLCDLCRQLRLLVGRARSHDALSCSTSGTDCSCAARIFRGGGNGGGNPMQQMYRMTGSAR